MILNKKPLHCLILTGFAAAFSLNSIYGQSLPVSWIDEHLRREQLSGTINPEISLLVRPLSIKTLSDSLSESELPAFGLGADLLGTSRRNNQTYAIRLLPAGLSQQFNSRRPYGSNDGSLIPSRGYQLMATAGVYGEFGPLSIQLKPEYVFAQNRDFAGFPAGHDENAWAVYYGFENHRDTPERFGSKAYSKFNWGQSSIRLNYGSISFGLSNENLWWGPGRRNALVMSNNAQGFKHLTLNTTTPIKTGIGTLEAQIVAGRLESSGFLPAGTDQTFQGNVLYNPKSDDWRYLSGISASYNPKWVPGLFLGFSRAFMVYRADMGRSFSDYLPVISPFQKRNAGDEDSRKRDQLTSLFARWLFIKSKAEVYLEFGRTDHALNIRDLIGDPEHSSAYIAGFSKIIPFSRVRKENLYLNVEVSSMRHPMSNVLREGGLWYVHNFVRHGYTHNGEIMGAAVGTGGSMQTFDLSWFKGLRSVGVQIERYLHNEDFYNFLYGDTPAREAPWVDASFKLYGTITYRKLLLNANITAIRSINYQWFPQNSNQDVMNWHGALGLAYRF